MGLKRAGNDVRADGTSTAETYSEADTDAVADAEDVHSSDAEELYDQPSDARSSGAQRNPFSAIDIRRNWREFRYRKQAMGVILVISLLMTIPLFYDYVTAKDRSDWAYEMTQIDDLYDDDYRGKGVTVGLIDTGIDPDHEALDHVDIVAWHDFINERPDPYDDQGHGTAVASILCGDDPLRGAAPKVDLIVCKVFDTTGQTDSSLMDDIIADAVEFCVENGADIISMSLGGLDVFAENNQIPSDRTEEECRSALDDGVFIVAAAGNDRSTRDDVETPGTVDDVICVGAVDKKGRIADFSQYGNNEGPTSLPIDDRRDPDRKPELVAPGVKILCAHPGDEYRYASGTSMSTPMVSGALALILEANPQYKHDGGSGGNRGAINTVKEVLANTAKPHSGQDTPHDDSYGYGLLQARDAQRAL